MGRAATVSAFGRGPPPRPQSLGGSPAPLSLHPAPSGRAPAGSRGLREIGSRAKPSPFLSAGAQGASMRAGCFAPAFVGLGVCFSLVASPAVLSSFTSLPPADDAPVVSLASQPSARCVLSAFVRARCLAPCARAPTCDNSKSTFKIYRAILYRTMDDFDFDFKLSNARRYQLSSGCSAPLTHPPPRKRKGGVHCHTPLTPLASVFHSFGCYRSIKNTK